MNYTENYHLPQWVETDRVLMEDFNAAMSSIENGLTRGNKTRSVLDDLCRDTYRQEIQLRLCHGPGGAQETMWVNPLATREDAGGDGHAWNSRYGVWLGSGNRATLEGIARTAKEASYVNIGPSVSQKRAVTTFTSDGFGMLETLTTWFTEFSGSSPEIYTYTIRLYRQDTGELVKEAGPFTYDHSGKIVNRTDFPLEINTTYRIEFDMPAELYRGRAGFMMGTSQLTDPSVVQATVGPRTAADTIVKTVTVPAGTGGITGMVRWLGTGTVGLTIGGQEASAVRTRGAIDGLGRACRETEFLLDQPKTGPVEVTLRMQTDGNDLHVFDYGLIWR